MLFDGLNQSFLIQGRVQKCSGYVIAIIHEVQALGCWCPAIELKGQIREKYDRIRRLQKFKSQLQGLLFSFFPWLQTYIPWTLVYDLLWTSPIRNAFSCTGLTRYPLMDIFGMCPIWFLSLIIKVRKIS